MNKSVLDASAFLAYLRDEPGAEIVENALIDGCYISIINILVIHRCLGIHRWHQIHLLNANLSY